MLLVFMLLWGQELRGSAAWVVSAPNSCIVQGHLYQIWSVLCALVFLSLHWDLKAMSGLEPLHASHVCPILAPWGASLWSAFSLQSCTLQLGGFVHHPPVVIPRGSRGAGVRGKGRKEPLRGLGARSGSVLALGSPQTCGWTGWE